jgi:hypothetical protein
MMWRRRTNPEAEQRTLDRRHREDGAPRLRAETPRLQSLSIELKEFFSRESSPDSVHIRRIVLETAPALFLFACGDPKCSGDHDLTDEVLAGLRHDRTRIEGELRCGGATGESACVRKVHYTAVATFS